MEYKVKIDAFEGPLDLLLHLIKQFEIDIYDIPVSKITDQYLDFIHQMRKMELNVASEYLVMAATLIAMKSRMLLPRPEMLDQDPEDDYEDPEQSRQQLMRQLIDYRRFKEAAGRLRQEESGRLLFFAKPADDLSGYEQKGTPLIPLANRSTVWDMVRALERMNARRRLQKPMKTKIEREVLPIGQQMSLLIGELKKTDRPISFPSHFMAYDRVHLVVTFLALLELMKKKAIVCRQCGNFNDIVIELGEGDVSFDTGEAFDY